MVVKLANPNADFPYLMTDYHMNVVPAPDGKPDLGSGIGTGIYKVVEFRPGVTTKIDRHPNAWQAGKFGFVDSAETLAVAEPNARLTALVSGTVYGGQVVIAAKAPRRRDLIGIIKWLTTEAERAGVDIRYNSYAEAAEIEAEDPDLVVTGTGGVPNTSFLEEGEDIVASTWDILAGHVPMAARVLVYDENGRHSGSAFFGGSGIGALGG